MILFLIKLKVTELKDSIFKILKFHSISNYYLTGGRLRQMFNLITDVGEELDQHLQKISKTQNKFELDSKHYAMRYTTEIIASCAFGIKGNSIDNENSEFLKTGIAIFNFTPLFRAFELATSFFLPELARLCRVRVRILIKIFKFKYQRIKIFFFYT